MCDRCEKERKKFAQALVLAWANSLRMDCWANTDEYIFVRTTVQKAKETLQQKEQEGENGNNV